MAKRTSPEAARQSTPGRVAPNWAAPSRGLTQPHSQGRWRNSAPIGPPDEFPIIPPPTVLQRPEDSPSLRKCCWAATLKGYRGARRSVAIFELRASGVLGGGSRWVQWAGVGRHVKLEFSKLAGRPMAGHGFLEPGMEVRILPGQPVTHPSGRVFFPVDRGEFRRNGFAPRWRRGAGENLQALPLPNAISSRRRGSKTAPKSRPY